MRKRKMEYKLSTSLTMDPEVFYVGEKVNFVSYKK